MPGNNKKMTVCRTLAVIGAFMAYVMLGGVIFHFCEKHHEEAVRENLTTSLNQFLDDYPCLNESSLENLFKEFKAAYQSGVSPALKNRTNMTNWDLYGSVFFSATIVTTLGYGNLVPKTSYGKLFVVIYTILGIELCIALLKLISIMQTGAIDHCLVKFGLSLPIMSAPAATGDGKLLTKSRRKYHAVRLLLNLVVLVVLFIFLPAVVFTLAEGWTYSESIYYACITVTTIGFGDYVAGFNPVYNQLPVYRLGVSLWIIFGLSSCTAFIGALHEFYDVVIPAANNHVSDTDKNIRMAHDHVQHNNTTMTCDREPSEPVTNTRRMCCGVQTSLCISGCFHETRPSRRSPRGDRGHPETTIASVPSSQSDVEFSTWKESNVLEENSCVTR